MASGGFIFNHIVSELALGPAGGDLSGTYPNPTVVSINGTPVGTAATANTGTSGATVPLLNGTNTWANAQTFTTAPVFTDQSGSRTALGLGTAATQNTGTSGATVPLLNGNWTQSGTYTNSTNGASSTSAVNFTGTPFSGTGTTSTPLVYINGGAAPTTWSTSGTCMGINAPSGFSGNFLEAYVNGGSSLFKVQSTGAVVMSGTLQSPTVTATTTLGYSTKLNNTSSGHLVASVTAPTIASGFGTGASIANNNGTIAFTVNVGTSSGSTGVITMPAATNGWACSVSNLSSTSTTVFLTKQTASSTTSITLGNFTTAGAAGAWNNNDILSCIAIAY